MLLIVVVVHPTFTTQKYPQSGAARRQGHE